MSLHLIETNHNVTADASSKVDLSLKVELDADEESGALELAILIDGTLDEVAWLSSLVSCH